MSRPRLTSVLLATAIAVAALGGAAGVAWAQDTTATTTATTAPTTAATTAPTTAAATTKAPTTTQAATTAAPATTAAATTAAPATTAAAATSPNDSDNWLLILIGIVIVLGIVAFFVGRSRSLKAKQVWKQQATALLDELSDVGINLAAAQPSAIPVIAARTEGRLVQLNAQLSTIHQRGPSAVERNALGARDQRVEHAPRDAHPDHAGASWHAGARRGEHLERRSDARQHRPLREAQLVGGRHHHMTKVWRAWGPAMVCAALAVSVVSACGGDSPAAASADPQDLQKKMQIVQQQFQAEQQVLDKNQDSILNIVSGGGTQAPADFFDFLRDPGILLTEIGDATEATSPDDLLVAWQAHADAWCALGSSDFDDAFFKVYGGAHVLPALVVFLDSSCGSEAAAALVAAADADGLGEGMASSGNPAAGIDLDELLTRLSG